MTSVERNKKLREKILNTLTIKRELSTLDLSGLLRLDGRDVRKLMKKLLDDNKVEKTIRRFKVQPFSGRPHTLNYWRLSKNYAQQYN